MIRCHLEKEEEKAKKKKKPPNRGLVRLSGPRTELFSRFFRAQRDFRAKAENLTFSLVVAFNDWDQVL